MQGPRWRPWPWALPALWVLAATLRWLVWPDDPLGLVLARDWGAPPDQVFPGLAFLPGLWAQAPLAHAVLWPAASAGAATFHLAQASLAGLAAPAAALAAAKAGRGWSLAAGILVAAQPAILGAGPGPAAFALPLLILGVAASASGRHRAAAVLLAAGGAMSVAVALAALPLAVHAALVATRRGEATWWPLQLDLRTTALVWSGLAGLVPAAYAWLVLDVGAVTGAAWTDPAIPVVPLAIVGLAACAVPFARDWGVAGLGSLALVVPLVAAGIVDSLAFVVPAGLLLVAAVRLAAAVFEPGQTGGGPWRASTMNRLAAARSLAAVAGVVLALSASAASALPFPDGGTSTVAALTLVPDDLRENVFVVDLRWQDVAWVAGEVGALGWAVSPGATDTGPWSLAVEEIANATLLRIGGTPLNEALREVYADCVVAQGAGHVVVAGQGCKGRGETLRAALADG
ncbi:MAG: hypothetical protein ACYC2H_06535 [Thermoplasmatota archaeon]